jgi:hypothetical protein
MMRRAVVDLRQAAPELVGAVIAYLDDPQPAVRIDAIGALARAGALPAAARLTQDLTHQLRARMQGPFGRDEKAALVLALGHLGADTASWLTDTDPAVRACAALFGRGDSRSTVILIDALTRPREADGWFTDGLPLIEGRLRFSLLRELLAREVVFADLLPAALAVVEVASGYTADFDWGPLLQAAFPQVTYVPGVPPPPPATLGDAQRALLQALVANESLWDPRNGNARLARMRIGLPNERSAVAKLAGC